jgi:preprotein translocase subunit SecY
VSVLPEFLLTGFKVQNLPWIGPGLDAALPRWITEGMGINFYFGGTSLLIVVGVAMDTIQQVESQLVMRNYEGFLKKGRLRGRR